MTEIHIKDRIFCLKTKNIGPDAHNFSFFNVVDPQKMTMGHNDKITSLNTFYSADIVVSDYCGVILTIYVTVYLELVFLG